MGSQLCDPEATIGLSDLPEEAIVQILRLLDARQASALLVQDRRMRVLAGDSALWRSLAQERWPGCSAAHYGGDWHRLYRCRASLPADFVREADRYHALTLRASSGVVRLNSSSVRDGGAAAGASGSSCGAGPGSPSKANVYGFSAAPHCNMAGMLLEEAMQAVFTVGLALSAGANTAVRRGEAAAELARFREDAAWWLAHRPEVVVRFVRRSCDALREYDMWGSGFSSWPDVPWRRSALQFVLDQPLGPDSGVCISVTDRLQREASSLDAAIRGLKGEACHLDVRRPQGVPRSHWWYFMDAAVH